jgi:hypothetical protein
MGASSKEEAETRRTVARSATPRPAPGRADRFAGSRRRGVKGPEFFVPGVEDGEEEREYGRLRQCVRADTRREPRPRRIFSLACRVEGADAQIEVGRPCPVDGRDVLAIFDVGGDEPYSIYTAGDDSVPAMRLGKRVYSVTEFA